MAENFQLYSRYYDLLYRDKDYYSESAYVIDLLKKYAPGAKNLLELGCGTGNHAAYLCKDGYTVTGLERSPEMVKLAQEKNITGFEPVVNDITDFSLPQKYDAALSLFHVISYLTENKTLLACFDAVQKHVKPGGLFIFDVWYSPAVYHYVPETRIRRLEDENIAVTRLAEPALHIDKNVVDVNYEIIIKDKASQQTNMVKEVHPMRHFSTPEIELLAIHTGFELIGSEEFMTGNAPSNDTWGVCYILKRK